MIDSEIKVDHADEPLSKGERSRFWKHKSFNGIELFHGSFRSYRFAKHFHRVPAIGVIYRGIMSTYFQKENHILGKGTVLLLNAGEVHAPAPAAESGWSFRMFYLDPAFLKRIFPEVPIPTLHFKTPFVQDLTLASRLFRLHAAMERPTHRLELESVFSSVFLDLSQKYAGNTFIRSTKKTDHSSLQFAIQRLHESYHRNISLEELAALTPFGPSHFLRVFKAVVGLTPHAYLLQLRVERAKALLRSRTAIVEVADRLGFIDQSHFTKSFKRILGVTPSKFAMSS